ncbi:hypothetical protein BY996DRAFT_6503534 [Phakopsora pachyrhizi]|nr:hypothetical protein BY996DRAFT_6503534 [Phakopsora pachyrhizi]
MSKPSTSISPVDLPPHMGSSIMLDVNNNKMNKIHSQITDVAKNIPMLLPEGTQFNFWMDEVEDLIKESGLGRHQSKN